MGYGRKTKKTVKLASKKKALKALREVFEYLRTCHDWICDTEADILAAQMLYNIRCLRPDLRQRFAGSESTLKLHLPPYAGEYPGSEDDENSAAIADHLETKLADIMLGIGSASKKLLDLCLYQNGPMVTRRGHRNLSEAMHVARIVQQELVDFDTYVEDLEDDDDCCESTYEQIQSICRVYAKLSVFFGEIDASK